MKSFLLSIILAMFLPTLIPAQTEEDLTEKGLSEKPLEEMNWDELSSKFEDLFVKGDLEQGIILAKKAVEVAELEFGTTDSRTGESYGNLAIVFHKLGQYEKALPLYIQSKEIIGKAVGKEDALYSASISNLSALYSSLGRYDLALPLVRESAEIVEKTHGKDSGKYGRRINSLASVYWKLDQFEEALPLFEEALELSAKHRGKDHPEYSRRLNNLAKTHESLGNNEQALSFYQQALQSLEQSTGKLHSEYGKYLRNIARLYIKMRQIDTAITYLIEAKDIVAKVNGKEKTRYSRCLNDLALCYETQGQITESALYLREASENMLNRINQQFDHFSQKEQGAQFNTFRNHFDQIQSFALRHPEHKEVLESCVDDNLVLKGLLLGNRGRLLKALQQNVQGELAGQFNEWETLRSTLANEYSKPLNKRIPAFDSLSQRANELESSLARQSQTLKKAKQMVRWQDIQAKLSDDEAAIEFANYRYFENGQWTDSIMYCAYVIRKTEAFPRMIPLFEETSLDSLMNVASGHKKQNLDNLYTYRGLKPLQSNANLSSSLTNLIWIPLQECLQDIKRIYYSSTGLLHRINIGALPIGENTILAEQLELYNLGSTRQIIFEQERNSFDNNNAVLYGGIRYDMDSLAMQKTTVLTENSLASRGKPELSRANRGDGWNYLPGTQKEVRDIAKLLQSSGMDVDVYEAHIATEEAFIEIGKESQSPHILHLATHGFFFPDPKMTKEKQANEATSFELSEHPMIRSGLIMAGGNYSWQGNIIPGSMEDGILTAYEISQMDLRNTELVVLSACETGLGDIEGNEGVYGLQRAFKIAGVRYILMSLWQVPDAETQELMSFFYSEWLKGIPIRKAFQGAQTHMRLKYKNPYYWAGFVLVE